MGLVLPFAAELLVLVGGGVLAALLALRWVVPVVSALPQLAPLETSAAPEVRRRALDAGRRQRGLDDRLSRVATDHGGSTAGADWHLRHQSDGTRPSPAALVVAQVAVSGTLIVAAGLLLRSAFSARRRVDCFEQRRRRTARLAQPVDLVEDEDGIADADAPQFLDDPQAAPGGPRARRRRAQPAAVHPRAGAAERRGDQTRQ